MTSKVMAPTARREQGGGVEPSDVIAAMPFCSLVGIECLEAGPDLVRGRLAWAPDRCTTGGLLHGGALMALADAMGGAATALGLPPGAGTATLASSTQLLRGVREGAVHATSTPLHRGRSTVVVRTDLVDDQGRLVATVTQTQAVLGT